MKRPHLLYLAFWFPPSRASGVYRALATTEAFVEAGWDVTVVTTTERFLEEEIGSTDPSLIDLIPDGVRVVRVPFSFRTAEPTSNLREMSRFRGNFPLVWRLMWNQTRSVRAAIDTIRGRSQDAHAIADNYVAWIDPVVSTGAKIDGELSVDHILATGNPYASFEAARILGNLLQIAYTVDYRDPWTIDVFTGGPASVPATTVAAEARIIDEAAACIHVNDAIAEAYADRHPAAAHKQYTVWNGHDKASISPVRPRYSGGPLTFGMLGTVNDRWPLAPIFEGWIDARSSLPEGSQLHLAGHLGYFDRSRETLEWLLPDESIGFRYVGPVPKAHVADFYSSLDVVVVPAPGGPMVTSGKVFEAVALGIPIVCVQSAGGGARRIVDEHPLGFGAEPDAQSVGIALIDAAAAARRLTEEESASIRRDMDQFERTRAMRTLVGVIEAANQREPIG